MKSCTAGKIHCQKSVHNANNAHNRTFKNPITTLQSKAIDCTCGRNMHGRMEVKFITTRMYTLYISSVRAHTSPMSHSFAEASSRPKNAIVCITIEYRRGIAAITGYVADHSKYTTNASRAEYSGTKGLQAPIFGRAIWRQNRHIANTYVKICILILSLTCKKSSKPPGWPRLAYSRVQHA